MEELKKKQQKKTVDSLFPSAFYKMAEEKLQTFEEESAQDQTLFLKGQRKSLRVSQSWERAVKNSQRKHCQNQLQLLLPSRGS